MCSWISFFCNNEVERAIALCDHLWEGASPVPLCVCTHLSLSVLTQLADMWNTYVVCFLARFSLSTQRK